MSARHVSALRRALRQCCGGTAARTVMVRTVTADPTGVVDPDVAATVRVCSADLARLMTELRGTGELTGYELSPPWAPGGARCGAADLADGESIAAPDDQRTRVIAGLRQLADLIADRPDLAIGSSVSVGLGIVADRAALAPWAGLLGTKVRMSDDTPVVGAPLAGVSLFVQSPEERPADPRVAELERRLAEAERKLAERDDEPEDPMASGRDIEVTVKPPPPGVEGIPVSSPPSWSGRPVSAPPATADQADPDPMHIGRAFAGNQVEQACACKLAQCGLVDTSDVDPDCEHHPAERRKTMRQMHRASACPALRGPR
ncbi:hypothetical protein ACFHW1_05140 [Micromonospora sp. LOL_014]|uniref:hypothetical protein n=1 Tax=Micromonospora sp. LOL_014 TaxID=3345415 RepID=UPI003A87C04D